MARLAVEPEQAGKEPFLPSAGSYLRPHGLTLWLIRMSVTSRFSSSDRRHALLLRSPQSFSDFVHQRKRRDHGNKYPEGICRQWGCSEDALQGLDIKDQPQDGNFKKNSNPEQWISAESDPSDGSFFAPLGEDISDLRSNDRSHGNGNRLVIQVALKWQIEPLPPIGVCVTTRS